MKAIAYFEMDVPQCSLTYGVSPCTASLTASPPTGTIKCFNSLGTCQDRANFTDVPVTLRFAEDIGILPTAIAAYPFIEKIDFTPAIVSLAGDLGQRATLKVQFKNARHSDGGPIFDKYPEDRDYDDPWSQGTFWGKFRARNPFLRSRPCRLIRGLVSDEFDDSYSQGDPLPDDTLDEQETRHFIIESINGPTADGEFSVIAKDVLKLADGDRAQAPVLSNGFLNAGIDDVVTSATLSPSGIGNAEYATSGFLVIGGNEGVSFTRSGDVLTITRGQLNTVAVSHQAGDRVQTVLVYVGEDGADILYDLWVRAGADVDWLPLSDWQLETASFLGTVYTLVITEPTPINKLVAEMLEHMGAALWWDDINQLIRLRVLRAIPTDVDRYNEDNVLERSLEVVEQPDKRVSRVIVYFAQFNFVKKIDDLENYRSTALVVDEASEEDEGTSSIKTIFARGIAAGGRSVAEIIGAKYLSRYVQPPRRFSFELMQYAGVTPVLGGGYRLGGGTPLIESWPFEDETGARVDAPMQITRVHPDGKIEAEEMLFTAFGGDVDPTTRIIIFDSNLNNVNLRTTHDQIYSDPESGDIVEVYINAGVLIGSVSTTLRAFDVGSWPAGVTVTINIAGRIEGAGGAGGNAPSVSGTNGAAGSPGGIALYTRYAVSVVQSSSQIWSGGGGGGSGAFGILGAGGGGGGGGGGWYNGAGGTGSGSAGVGASGSSEVGGAGGSSVSTGVGGAGGNPGSAGSAGGNESGFSGGAGGAVGTAIDGISFVTLSGSGSVLGTQVN